MANGGNQALVVRPEELDQPGGGPLVVRPEELDEAPKANPPKQGFKRSLRSAFGLKPEGGLSDDISQIGEGFQQMYHHPLTSANDLVEGLYGAQEDVARKGSARMAGSDRLIDRVSGAAQGLESFIPGVGPILSRMGEQTEEGDYTGAAGTGMPLATAMDTGPLRGAIGDVARTPGGAVRTAPRLVTQIAAGAAGHELMPYAGGYLGYKAGGPLADMIVPARTPKAFPGAKATPWEAPVAEAPAPASEATQTLRGNKTLFDVPGATSSAAGGARGPEGPLAKPRLSARETSEYLKSKGRSTGRLSEDIDTADAADTGTRTEENLSPYMQRKVGEAEGRHDAGRMAATGAVTGEDSRVANAERRVNPGLRAATGPDPVRQSLVREAQKVIDDPGATARDKRIAKAQIADIQAHPFEGAGPGKDFVKEARGNKPRMSRKEAEAASEKRSGARGAGRKKRLAEEMGND